MPRGAVALTAPAWVAQDRAPPLAVSGSLILGLYFKKVAKSIRMSSKWAVSVDDTKVGKLPDSIKF